MSYNAFLLQRGELPLRLRELAILRLAHARRSAFFWGEHVRVATAGDGTYFAVETYGMLAMACDTWQLVPPPGSAKLPD
jgi:4-carboxymuconolactone decarboxylase